jgi:hypothetical protein
MEDLIRANHVRINEILQSIFPTGNIRLARIHLEKEGYIVEEFDKSRPLYREDVWLSLSKSQQDFYISTLTTCHRMMAKYDYYLKDIELYIQPDNSLIMSNISRIHHNNNFKIDSATILPSVISENHFK